MADYSNTGTLPLFIKNVDIPDSRERPLKVYEMCRAAQEVTGQNTMLGAQIIKGLWRLYPKKNEDREKLIEYGIYIRNVHIQPWKKNPYSITDDGNEKPTTKVWIDNIPISVANEQIEIALNSKGVEFRSQIIDEKARDFDNKLTDFLTGRRFVIITVPETPLDTELQINGNFKAKIFHWEQKFIKRPPKVSCSRCLMAGHHVTQCMNDIVCKLCKQPGHKQGDAYCLGLNQLINQQSELEKHLMKNLMQNDAVQKENNKADEDGFSTDSCRDWLPEDDTFNSYVTASTDAKDTDDNEDNEKTITPTPNSTKTDDPKEQRETRRPRRRQRQSVRDQRKESSSSRRSPGKQGSGDKNDKTLMENERKSKDTDKKTDKKTNDKCKQKSNVEKKQPTLEQFTRERSNSVKRGRETTSPQPSGSNKSQKIDET